MLDLATTARSLLGDDLPLIADDVTVEHLLAHRSGIGDYLDEEAGHDITDYVMPVPVHELATTEQFLAVLDGHPDQCSRPASGSRTTTAATSCSRCWPNGRAASPSTTWCGTRVCEPGGHGRHRVPALRRAPGRAALGLPDRRRPADERVPPPGARQRRRRHLLDRRRPQRVLGARSSPDGSSPPAGVAEMVRPRSDGPEESKRYGLGFRLHETTDAVRPRGVRRGRVVPPACTTRRRRPPTPSSRTGPRAPGTSSAPGRHARARRHGASQARYSPPFALVCDLDVVDVAGEVVAGRH